MKLSKSLKRIILLEIGLPIFLLSIGLLEGLFQTMYRSGLIHKSQIAGINYYQGLTLHGVINAVVLTTFFAVAFGHACMTFFLKREPNHKMVVLSFFSMLIGTLMAAWAMLSGKASVLYTFYPPLQAHPLFYLGAALLIVGSWLAFFSWIKIYLEWRKENKESKIPIPVLGTLINFTIWFTCTLAVAFEVIFLLLPWSMGWVQEINIPLSRTLFWFFGHALVYFWLLPAYIMFYSFLPKLAGGKLYSENAARLVFFLFLILSVPVGVHHQFSEPGITKSIKWVQMILTFGVALPSLITAFTLAASLENAAFYRGSKGYFNWIFNQPYFDKVNYLFSYLICGLILFIFGGLTGLVNASSSLNATVHNTAFIPGHFHMTVAGPVFLAILGMSMYLVQHLSGKELKLPVWNAMVPYLWTIGILIFSTGLMWGGLMGEPRRTNLGLTYLNPSDPLFHSEWVPSTILGLLGGIIMFVAGFMFLISFFSTLFSKSKNEIDFTLPISKSLEEDSKRYKIFDTFWPWVIIMIVVILMAYIPALLDVFEFTGKGGIPYDPSSPLPIK